MDIACFGSLNYDLSIWIDRLPAPDETRFAQRIEGFCGGKGANQATAAARLGAGVEMIGCVGTDGRGDELLAGLARNGVGAELVQRVEEPTGTAFPIITPENVSIIIARGANGITGPRHADAAAAVIEAASVLMLQGEVGGEGAARAAAIARAAGSTVIFNPAPVSAAVVSAVLPHASVLVANDEERKQLDPPADLPVVVTRGAAGAWVGDVHVPAFPAEVVDPTGAGDAFCGALAVALAEGADLVEATRFGAAAGALAVGVAGAEPSMPTRPAVDHLVS